MSQNYSHTLPSNHKIHISTFGNSNLEKRNCLIFVHGFKGFKDWGFGPYLGKYFSEQGFFIITFNFSHNGVAENTSEFNELEKFANNTYSKEVNEINEVVELYKSGFFGKINPLSKVGLIGHSRGGGVAIVAASMNKNINALATWSAISKFDRFSDRQKNEWRLKGYLEIQNARTKQIMRLNKVLLNDIEKNKYKIQSSIKSLSIPVLIVHGDQDLAVPINEAENLYNWSNKELTDYFRIQGTGHTFDIQHPFSSSSKAFDEVLNRTNKFFQTHLQS